MIIHSPIISGSLTFADGATFTLPDNGVYSGSFSGSIQISEVKSHLVPDTALTYDLGSSNLPFRDLYLSTSSIFFEEVGKISFSNSGNSGNQFFVSNEIGEPAPIQISKMTFKATSTAPATVAIPSNGGVSFLNVGEGQCAIYSIDNADLILNLAYDFIDCDGNPQSATVNANTNNHTLQAQEGSFVRTGGSDNYRIELVRYINATPTPVNVGSITLTPSSGSTADPIVILPPSLSGDAITITISGSTDPAPIQTGNIIVSGSNGLSTITNDLPGEGLAVTDSTGSLTPIKVKTVEIVDSVSGDVISLFVNSGSLNTTATNSSGSALPTPKSNLSGSFTGSLDLTGDLTSNNANCIKIGTVANPICEIHGTDIFGAINSTNGVVSGSVQVDVEQTTNFNSFSASIASTFAGLTSEFNDISNNPFSQSASSVTVSKSIIPTSTTIDLGSVAVPFRDLYLSSASLYINGTQVLSTDAQDLTLTTDANQSLRLVETGADTITLQTQNGDITLTATGTGNIELDAPVQILAGNKILSSDGNAIVFGEDIDIEGNITLSGTVDSVDIAAFKSAFDTLSGKALVSGSSQILTLVSIDEDNMASDSNTKLPTQQSVKKYVDDKVAGLVDSAPGALDTLNELAAALGDDANFSTTLTNSIGLKADKTIEIIAGNGLTGGGDLNANRTLNVVGTTNRISVTSDAIDIASTYVGQSSITTLGTIGTGTWQGSVIASAYLDADTAHLTTTQTFSGAKTFSAAVSVTDSTASTSKTTGALKVTGGISTQGDLFAGGDVVAYASSDERLKKNIEIISNPIQKVQQLKGVTWNWKDEASDAQKATPALGVIAQDVEKVLPQLVDTRENGYKAVDYGKMVGLLIEAIKDQQKQIDDLKSKLQ